MNKKALLAMVLAASAVAACAPRYGYYGHRGYGYDRPGHHGWYDRDRYDRDHYNSDRYRDDYRR
jgi:hypothetical protein